MKRFGIISSLVLIFMAGTPAAFGQKGCDLNIVGTWKAVANVGTWKAESTTLLYRFGADGTVAVLSAGSGAELRETGKATYTLQTQKASKHIAFTASDGIGAIPQGTTSMEITAYDDSSFTAVRSGSTPVRWIKIEPFRYYLVLAGRSGVFYDGGGPTFPMLIKLDGKQTEIEAVGIYSAGGGRAFGAIPSETYNQFMKEPRSETDVMLRLEINGAQYQRSLKILRSWDRRAREHELLYADPYLDNVLLVKQVSESLNQCGETVNLYKLDWGIEDHISDRNLPARAPFLFFKEMRRRNERLHVRDDKFYERSPAVQQPAGQ